MKKAIVLDYANGIVHLLHLQNIDEDSDKMDIDEKVRMALVDESINPDECHYMILSTDEFSNFNVNEIYYE